MDASRPELYYQQGSRYIENVIANCSTLQTGYTPPTLWGRNGHVQTTLFGTVGRTSVPELPQQRFSLTACDGSTLFYDVFEPEEDRASGSQSISADSQLPYTVLICPGINNSSESSYVRTLAAYCLDVGYRVIVFNHLGALKSEKLTGHRIFTYGGTGDITLVFEDACRRYPHTKFLGIGFSLGACILVRFLGEKGERRRKFVCAASLCQGYDPSLLIDFINDWKHMRRLYNFQISKLHKKVILRHQHQLFPPQLPQDASGSATEDDHQLPKAFFNGFQTEVTHDGHNCNGCSLDRRKCTMPDLRALVSSTTLPDLDEAYTRRVLGFDSVDEMYRWVSCEKLLYQIDDLPMLLVNAVDDPCVISDCHYIPKKFVENQSKSVFVLTQYGGHLGFYEGGVVPNKLTWLDRLIVEFSKACIKANQDQSLSS